MNAKFIAFIAGSTVGALSAITGIAITAKVFNKTFAEEEKEQVNTEIEFFTGEIRKYFNGELHEEEIDKYISVIEDVCKNFQTDYRKFLVTLYELVVHDKYERLIEMMTAIEVILEGYTDAKCFDTTMAIEKIIKGEYRYDGEKVVSEASGDAVTA